MTEMLMLMFNSIAIIIKFPDKKGVVKIHFTGLALINSNVTSQKCEAPFRFALHLFIIIYETKRMV
jgi:hypothetical protein